MSDALPGERERLLDVILTAWMGDLPMVQPPAAVRYTAERIADAVLSAPPVPPSAPLVSRDPRVALVPVGGRAERGDDVSMDNEGAGHHHNQPGEYEMADVPQFTELKPAERSRTYVFPGGERVTYADVKRLAVSERGTHRLELGDGRKVIVPTGWLAVELDMDGWTL